MLGEHGASRELYAVGCRAWLGSSILAFLEKSAGLPAQAGWRIEPRRAERKRCRCYARVRQESPTPDGLARIPQARRFIKGYVEILNFRRGGQGREIERGLSLIHISEPTRPY